jgi:predicted nucleic acid-binding protein
MLNACFIDTNVFLYAKDPKVPIKRVRARGWLEVLAERQLGVVSPQVLNEFAHNILRNFPEVTYLGLRDNLEAMVPFCRAPVTERTAVQALAIHRRFKISFCDSALVATALTYGCDLFLSEDLGHNQRLGDMRIVNPFLVEPRHYLEKN